MPSGAGQQTRGKAMAMESTENTSLIVDLYELTMAAAYFQNRVRSVATFELFVREMPPERSYLVAAGIESALDYLESLRFTADQVEFLRAQPAFRTVQPEFFDFLEKFRFTGEVHAVPEGTLVFGEEPLLRVTAPILEAQIVETYLLSVIHFETLIASKAARVVEAARGRSVLEFGTRRAHGPEAGVRAAKAAFVGGARRRRTSWPAGSMGFLWPVRPRIPGAWCFPPSAKVLSACSTYFPNPPSCWLTPTMPFGGPKWPPRWDENSKESGSTAEIWGR